MEGDIVRDTPGDTVLEGAAPCQRKDVSEEWWPMGNTYRGRDIPPGTAAHRQPMPEQTKMLKKQGAVEENKKPGSAERNHYTLTSASCTAHHITKQIGTD